jgi:hypothetical protein
MLQHTPDQLASIAEHKAKLKDCAQRLSNLTEVMEHIISVVQKSFKDFPTFVFNPSIHVQTKS